MIIRNDTREIPNRAFTHGSMFHSDDVFSAALLKTLNPNIVIERGFHVPDNYDGIVFDIGMGEFDHHQADNEVRENGVPYASFGKLWQAFGYRLVNDESVDRIDQSLVQAIDYTDNTGDRNPLSAMISTMNPSWNDEYQDYNGRFEEAVNIAKTFLSNAIQRERDREKAQEIAEKARATGEKIIVLKKFAPIAHDLVYSEAEFLIYPSLRGGYNVQTIPTRPGGHDSKIPLPESWAGMNEGLSNISNIEDMTFCHAQRHLCSADTLEGAIKAAVVAMTGQDRYIETLDPIVEQTIPANARKQEHTGPVIGE